MRIIPKKTKVSTEFFRGVRLADVIIGFIGVLIMFAVFMSSLPYRLWIDVGLLFLLGLLLVRVDDDPVYAMLLQILRHYSYKRRFQKMEGEPRKEEKQGKKDQKKSAESKPAAREAKLAEKQRKKAKKAEDRLLKDKNAPEAEKNAIRQRRKQEAEESYQRSKIAEQKKNRLDIRKMTLVSQISGGFIHYGTDYYGAAVEIPAIELRFFSETRRTNAIDRALGSVIRSVGESYAANIVKLERPLVLDGHIKAEYAKIEALKRNFERGVINEQEMQSRIEVIYERINSLMNYNQDDKVLVPHFYLVLFDSDKRQLENQLQSAISALEQGEMFPKRLDDKELAVFLRYTNSVDFDEREIEKLAPEEYVSFILPDSLEIKGRTIEVNSIITHNFRVISYPVSVGDAWGAALFDIPGTKVMVKLSQMDREKSIRTIDRSIGELTSQLEKTSLSSRILELQTHIETLSQLLVLLQNNNESLMAMNLYITAYDIAATRDNRKIAPPPPPSSLPRVSGMKRSIRRAFTEQGFKLNDLMFQQFEAYVATQVNAYDPLKPKAIGIPSSTLAAVFPWIYPIVNDPKGLNLGTTDGVPTFVDFFRRDNDRVNSNMVIVGKSGGGKSYATKSILSNLAADDAKIFVLDPENEYTQLAGNLKGKYINVANSSHGRINPFQIITSLEDDEAEAGQETSSYAAHLQFLEEFFRQILPDIDSDALEYLNNLINRVYVRRGIDPSTNLTALKPEDYPIFDDLYDCILEEFQRTNSDYLKSNLRVLMNYIAKFSTGGRNANIWNGPSTLSTVENFIVFNFQSLLANRNNTIANAQMLLVLKYLDNEIIKNRDYNIKYGASRKIVVVIDEAHVFIDSKYPLALDFMYQMAKRIRKYNGMLVVITQNIKDFVGSEELARKSTAIINACQYSFIFSLAPNDMHDLCTLYEKAGGINASEQEKIVSAKRGEAFLITGPNSRTSMNIVTPRTVERIFSDTGYESRYFSGENGAKNWEDVVGGSRALRSAWEEEQPATPESEEELVLPIFSGVKLVEVEEMPEPVPVAPVEPVAPAPEAPKPQTSQDPFTLDALQRYGFEALLEQVRQTVRQEIENELGMRKAQPAPSVPEPQPEFASSFDLFAQTQPERVDDFDLFTPAQPVWTPEPEPAQDMFSGDLFAPAPESGFSLFDDLFSVPDSEPEPQPAPKAVEELDLDGLSGLTDAPAQVQPEPRKASRVVELTLEDLMNLPD